MPAATAEKRARQRANKLKSSASSAQTPEIVLPTDSTPILQTSIPPVDFSFFIQNASIIDVHDFLAMVSATTDGRNLKLLWKCAFEEGRNHGLDEGMFKCSEDYARGLKAGTEMATTYFDAGREQGTEEGVEHGREVERQAWLTSGHDDGQCTPTSKPRLFTSTAFQTDNSVIVPAHLIDSNVQTDPLHATVSESTQTPTISCLDVLIQAPEPPSSLSQPQKAIAKPLDWAEDAKSLPITPIPPSPRDLSVLRSPSSSSPFSSLQHRSKRFSHYSHQARHHRPNFNFNSFNSPHRNSYKPSQPYFHTKTYSHLNWESDPRLSDLSRSLKALGWIRAS